MYCKDYKIPGTNIQLKVDDLISVAVSGIQASRIATQNINRCTEYFKGSV